MLRAAVVAEVELDGRRVGDVLERDGFAVAHATTSDILEPNPQTDVVVVVLRGTATAAKTWLESLADRPVVVVASALDRDSLDSLLGAGLGGFVAEEDVDERLAATVLAVSVGQLAIPAELREAAARPFLTAREKQVLSMVVLGFSNFEIASKLHVAETTVKSHLSTAYRKLGVRSRHQAAAMILDPRRGAGLGILAISSDPPLAPRLR
jgi:DNA-binding NarL/FixJ family response regulator